MKLSPEAAALLFINKHYPNCSAAFLAGSVVRGDDTKNSDLDLVIIDSSNHAYYRANYEEYQWPIEVFVYTKDRFYPMFESDCLLGIPYLPRMCAEGKIIKDVDGLAKTIKKDAITRIEEGPFPWTENQIKHARYVISDLIDDLAGSENDIENLFIAAKLSQELHEFILRVNGHWIGYGKWIVRALKQYDADTATQFTAVFDQFFQTRKPAVLIRYAEEVLKPYGGKLFKGYKS